MYSNLLVLKVGDNRTLDRKGQCVFGGVVYAWIETKYTHPSTHIYNMENKQNTVIQYNRQTFLVSFVSEKNLKTQE